MCQLLKFHNEIGSGVYMFTEEGLKNLYILEPSQNRVIVLNKETNELVAQLKSDQLANALDFVVYQRDNNLYVLLPGGIVKVSVQEFEG